METETVDALITIICAIYVIVMVETLLILLFFTFLQSQKAKTPTNSCEEPTPKTPTNSQQEVSEISEEINKDCVICLEDLNDIDDDPSVVHKSLVNRWLNKLRYMCCSPLRIFSNNSDCESSPYFQIPNQSEKTAYESTPSSQP